MVAAVTWSTISNFDLGRFRHHAFFNETASRVEMHLVSLEAQVVHVTGERIAFEAGESTWTESSYKYDRETLDTLVTSAGFRITRSACQVSVCSAMQPV